MVYQVYFLGILNRLIVLPQNIILIQEIFFELGRRKIVAGQEDIIIEVAVELKSRSE